MPARGGPHLVAARPVASQGVTRARDHPPRNYYWPGTLVSSGALALQLASRVSIVVRRQNPRVVRRLLGGFKRLAGTMGSGGGTNA